MNHARICIVVVDAHMPALPDVRLRPSQHTRKGVPASLHGIHPVVPTKKNECTEETVCGTPFPCRDALLRGTFFKLSAVVRGQGQRCIPPSPSPSPGAVYITPALVAGTFPVCQKVAALLSVSLPCDKKRQTTTLPCGLSRHRPFPRPVPPVPDGGLDWTEPPPSLRLPVP
jgi:hypothetical protein